MRPLILAYHGIGDDTNAKMFVTESAFRTQVEYFHGHGYSALTLSDCERLRGLGELPEKTVVFTFDDALDSVRKAVSVLASVGWPGTVFVVTDYAGTDNSLRWWGLEPGLVGLQWPALHELATQGWEIGSHTCSHSLLTTLSEPDLHQELAYSRSRIASKIGTCEALAYPYGAGDERTAAVARDCGYLVACTLTGAEVSDSTFLRPRLRMDSRDVSARLVVKTSDASLWARRSSIAKAIRRLPRRRSWMP